MKDKKIQEENTESQRVRCTNTYSGKMDWVVEGEKKAQVNDGQKMYSGGSNLTQKRRKSLFILKEKPLID